MAVVRAMAEVKDFRMVALNINAMKVHLKIR